MELAEHRIRMHAKPARELRCRRSSIKFFEDCDDLRSLKRLFFTEVSLPDRAGTHSFNVR